MIINSLFQDIFHNIQVIALKYGWRASYLQDGIELVLTNPHGETEDNSVAVTITEDNITLCISNKKYNLTSSPMVINERT